MDKIKLQAWWSHKQALDGRLRDKPASDVLEQTGWARSVGGVGPYLTLFSRAGLSRQAVDDAAARLEIYELPAARGCTYVVPAADFGLALKVGQGFGDERKVAARLGVKDAEIEKLCAAVLNALSNGPLDPDGLREAPGGAVRNLGEEGKKKGLTTTLPVALGSLQSDGKIRRVPVSGRFDQQRYRYALWRPSPLDTFKMSMEEAFVELARRYFSWIGPATLLEFQWFSGLAARDARTAVEALGLMPVEDGSERLMLPEDLDDFHAFKAPRHSQFVLAGSLDGIFHLRRDVEGLLAPEDLKLRMFCGKGLVDLSSHAILDRGRLVGLWEYDVDVKSVVWMSFVPRSRALEAAVTEVETLVREELGDARSFSLDSPKSRAPRIEALRRAGKA